MTFYLDDVCTDDWMCTDITWTNREVEKDDNQYDPHAHAHPGRMQPRGHVDFGAYRTITVHLKRGDEGKTVEIQPEPLLKPRGI